MQHCDFVKAIGDIFRWIRNRSRDQKESACKEYHLRMLYVQMLAVTRMDTKRDEWRSLEQTLNFFRIHDFVLTKNKLILNGDQLCGGAPKWAANAV